MKNFESQLILYADKRRMKFNEDKFIKVFI